MKTLRYECGGCHRYQSAPMRAESVIAFKTSSCSALPLRAISVDVGLCNASVDTPQKQLALLSDGGAGDPEGRQGGGGCHAIAAMAKQSSMQMKSIIEDKTRSLTLQINCSIPNSRHQPNVKITDLHKNWEAPGTLWPVGDASIAPITDRGRIS